MKARQLSEKELFNARLLRWKCRTDLEFLCQNVLGYPDINRELNGPLIDVLQKFPYPKTQQKFEEHDHWDGKKWNYKPLCSMQALEGGRRALLLDPRGYMKCICRINKLQTIAGNYITPEELRVGDKLWGIDDNTFQPRVSTVVAIEEQEAQPAYRIDFRSGRSMQVSHNHPLRFVDGWRWAEEVRVGDRIGVVNKRPVLNGKPLAEAEFLGWMIGDGCCPNTSFTNGLEKFRERFRSRVTELGGGISRYTHQSDIEVNFTGLRNLLRTHGILECRSGNKFVPKAVFEADDNSVIQFLYAYLMCDGTLNKGTGVSWTSKSEVLANDIRRLLGRFGIPARVRPVVLKSGPYAGNTYYYGYVSTRREVEKILQLFSWDKPHTWDPDADGLHNPNLDVVPLAWRELYPKYFFKRGDRPAWLAEKWNRKGRSCVSSCSKYGGKKEYIHDLGIALNDETLKNLGSDQIFWDEVSSIEFIGEEKTWAVQTDIENFCVDDVITHNTALNAQSHTIQWMLNYPDIAMAVFQSNLEKAEMILLEIKNQFTNNDRMRQIFPEFCPKPGKELGTKSQFISPARSISETRREPTLMALSIEKGLAGLHFHVMKFSDIVEPENVKTDQRIADVISAFRMAENLLISPVYWIDVEGTRYHYADLYGELIDNWLEEKKNGAPHQYKIHVRGCYQTTLPKEGPFTPDNIDAPLIYDAAGKPISLFPVDSKGEPRFPTSFYEEMKKNDAYMHNCQHRNRPKSDGKEVMFPTENIVRHNTISPENFRKNIRVSAREVTVDTAETIGPRSNYTAIVVGAWDGYGRCYVEDIVHEKLLPSDLVSKLFEINRKHRPSRIVIEETGFVRGLHAAIERTSDITGVYLPLEFTKRDNKEAKTERIAKSLQKAYGDGDIRFVVDLSLDEDGISREPSWWAPLKKELEEFPVSKTDDILDALADQFAGKDYFGRLQGRPGYDAPSDLAQNHAFEKLFQLVHPLSDDYEPPEVQCTNPSRVGGFL